MSYGLKDMATGQYSEEPFEIIRKDKVLDVNIKQIQKHPKISRDIRFSAQFENQVDKKKV
jgi:hypothetical protein